MPALFPVLIGGIEVRQRKPRREGEPIYRRLDFIRARSYRDDYQIVRTAYPKPLFERNNDQVAMSTNHNRCLTFDKTETKVLGQQGLDNSLGHQQWYQHSRNTTQRQMEPSNHTDWTQWAQSYPRRFSHPAANSQAQTMQEPVHQSIGWQQPAMIENKQSPDLPHILVEEDCVDTSDEESIVNIVKIKPRRDQRTFHRTGHSLSRSRSYSRSRYVQQDEIYSSSEDEAAYNGFTKRKKQRR